MHRLPDRPRPGIHRSPQDPGRSARAHGGRADSGTRRRRPDRPRPGPIRQYSRRLYVYPPDGYGRCVPAPSARSPALVRSRADRAAREIGVDGQLRTDRRDARSAASRSSGAEFWPIEVKQPPRASLRRWRSAGRCPGRRARSPMELDRACGSSDGWSADPRVRRPPAFPLRSRSPRSRHNPLPRYSANWARTAVSGSRQRERMQDSDKIRVGTEDDTVDAELISSRPSCQVTDAPGEIVQASSFTWCGWSVWVVGPG